MRLAVIAATSMRLRPPAKACRAALLLAAVLALASGCAGSAKGLGIGWTDRSGVRHALILGFGMVSLTNGPMSALDVRAAGLVLDRGASLGIVRRHTVEIDPGQAGNAVASIHTSPFSLTVKTFDPGPANLPANCNSTKERNPPP